MGKLPSTWKDGNQSAIILVVGNDLGGNKSASVYSGSSQDTTYSYLAGSFLHNEFKKRKQND